MKKETAVEWLIDQLKERGYAGEFPPHLLFEQAKTIEREQMLKLISFVRMHNKMGKSAENLLQEFETYKGGQQ